MAVVIPDIVFTRFARTYYLRSLFLGRPLAAFLKLHGFVFTSWPLLLLIQTVVVAAMG